MFVQRLQLNELKNNNLNTGFQCFTGLKLRIKKAAEREGLLKGSALSPLEIGFIALNGRKVFFY